MPDSSDCVRVRIPKALDAALARATDFHGDKQAEARVLFALQTYFRDRGSDVPARLFILPGQRRVSTGGTSRPRAKRTTAKRMTVKRPRRPGVRRRR